MPWTYTLGDVAGAAGAAPPTTDPAFSRVSTDSRRLEPGDLFIALRGDQFDGARFVPDAFARGACAAVTTEPCDAGPCLVVADPLDALQRFAAWHRSQYTLPVIAITGSCGKTSTKDMTAAVLGGTRRVVKTPGNLNNEIGCPLSLLRLDERTQAAVIEMGANHEGEIARLCELARPTESLIIMVAPAHLEGFGTVDDVARAKGEIIRGLPPGGVFYLNADDPRCVREAADFNGEVVRVGRTGADYRLKDVSPAADGELVLDIDPVGRLRLPLLNRAHAINALFAVAVGHRHGVTAFEGPLREACANPARFRRVLLDGLEIIDDAYNANPASVASALETLAARPGRPRVAVLGDMLELGAMAAALHRDTGALAGRLGIDVVLARGDFAEQTVAGARDAGAAEAAVIQDHEALAGRVAALKPTPGNGQAAVLVKGSRGMRMERVIEALQAREGRED